MSAADGGNWSAVDAQALRSFFLQTPADHDRYYTSDNSHGHGPLVSGEQSSEYLPKRGEEEVRRRSAVKTTREDKIR